MKLQIGERLSGSGPRHQPGGYVVTDVISETPWHGLYSGKRILYNFDFSAKRVRETDEKEWLDVLLRTNQYPYLDDAQYVARRRELARAEVRLVLGRGGSNLWPEPIDLLEITNSRDVFAFSQATADLEPVTVVARLHGQPLTDWQRQPRAVTSTLSVLFELLEFIEQCHEDGLVLQGLGPASILIDQAERAHYIGSDMVRSAEHAPSPALWSRLYPAERFPPGFSPPECFAENSHGNLPGRSGDLYAWGCLAYFLLTEQPPDRIAQEQGSPCALFQDAHFAVLEKALGTLPSIPATKWLEQIAGPADGARPVWPTAFLDLMKLILDPDPRCRPGTVAELRRWLVVPPPPSISEMPVLRIGPKMLSQLGIHEAKQAERLTICGECRKPVLDLETHLLAEHRICQFHGERLSAEEMKTVLLNALCRKNPDVAAVGLLETLARTQENQADNVLATWLCQRLVRVSYEERPAVFAALAEALGTTGVAGRLLPLLLTLPVAEQNLARNLALELTARHTGRIDDKTLARLKPLLGDLALPGGSRQNAVIGLLRIVGKDGPMAYDLLSAYAAGPNRTRALEQLRELEQQFGQSAMLDRLQNEIMDSLPMTCPGCAKQLMRKDMTRHVWEQHRLVLDGLRARKPWRVLEDWVVDYRLERDPALLQRCTDLARDVGGDDGVFQLHQLMLKHGIDDRQTRAAVLDRAREQHATVCPNCFHLSPLPRPIDFSPLTWSAGEFEGNGYLLSGSDRGPMPTVTITAENEVLYNGREPGRLITRIGAPLVFFIPVILGLFVVMTLMEIAELPSVRFLLATLGGLVAAGIIYFTWPNPRPKRDRLIDAAWSLVVPGLIDDKISSTRAAFLGALAKASRGRGLPAIRAALLEKCLKEFKKAGKPKLQSAYVALLRLLADDQARAGADPLPALLEVVRTCLAGKNSLALLDALLAEFNADEDWNKMRYAHLKTLLVEAIFSSGVELRDLPDLAQAYSALGAMLDVRNANLLVGLRHLCSLKASKPWDKQGKAMTVFELAAEFEQSETLLNKYPGLLLAVTGEPIFLALRGLWCKDICMKDKPRTLEVTKLAGKDNYQLILGQEHLWFDQSPDELLEQLTRWATFYFDDFKPALKKFPLRRGGEGMKKLLSKNAVACSQCGKTMLPRVGAVGVDITVKEG